MRKKEEILEDARRDITNMKYRDTAHLWLCVRQFEILIDLRDILRLIEFRLAGIGKSLHKP